MNGKEANARQPTNDSISSTILRYFEILITNGGALPSHHAVWPTCFAIDIHIAICRYLAIYRNVSFFADPVPPFKCFSQPNCLLEMELWLRMRFLSLRFLHIKIDRNLHPSTSECEFEKYSQVQFTVELILSIPSILSMQSNISICSRYEDIRTNMLKVLI